MAIKDIELFLTDVDGCLTDGKVYLGVGEELSAFDIQDGIGHRLAVYGGLRIGWLSGRISKPVARRAKHLKVPYLFQGKLDKLIAAQALCKKLKLDLSRVAYMGDDLIDIPLLSRVGFSATNPYGRPEVKKVVDYVTKAPAGGGAFREVVEHILKGQGRWKKALDLFHRNNVRIGSGAMLV
ncbi:MAG TPA: HAD hydrolase family protein [bacterium]|nr:HAD hydrolase family protein [bacterium]